MQLALQQQSVKSLLRQRLHDEAPYIARCSDNKTAAIARPRQIARKHPYMQVNRSGMVSWLVFDLDHANSLAWDDAGLPPPNLSVRNRETGLAHLFYAITPVCTTVRARSAPISYMKAIYRSMAVALQADLAYSGPVAKTPFHPWWSTTQYHTDVYDLGDLAEYVDIEDRPRWSPDKDEENWHSRNCQLFDRLRRYAYSIVKRAREEGSFEQFSERLAHYAADINTFNKKGFEANLSTAEVKATVKSVSRWTWDRYEHDSRCNRNVMQLDDRLPLNERQRLAATHTHQIRRSATEKRITDAINELNRLGISLTHTAIAKKARLSRQTVARYRNHSITDKPQGLTRASKRSYRPVNYAPHQITPAFRRGCFFVPGRTEGVGAAPAVAISSRNRPKTGSVLAGQPGSVHCIHRRRLIRVYRYRLRKRQRRLSNKPPLLPWRSEPPD